MFWSVVLLVVVGACFLWMRRAAAVIANACPLRSAEFFQEVVRDGSGRGVCDHRDATVHWDSFFSLSYPRLWREMFCHLFWHGSIADCISYLWRGRPSNCKQSARLARIHTRKFFLCVWLKFFQAHIAVIFVCILSKRLITSHASHVPHAGRPASDITFTELSCFIFSTVPVTLACHIHSAKETLVWPICRTVHAHSNQYKHDENTPNGCILVE